MSAETDAAYQEALIRIHDCKVYERKALDLSRLSLTVIPSEVQQLIQLQVLYLANTPVKDVSGLAPLTQLQVLDLANTQVKDVSGLTPLTQLTYLDLADTPVTDVSGLAPLTQLTYLNLGNTPVTDVSVLASLTQLQELCLGNTPVSDVSVLASLTQLQELYLGNTPVSDVSVLASLTQLQELTLHNTPVKDVSGLAPLTQLTYLDLANTPVKDVSGLAPLTQLQELDLANTQVKDVSGLAPLTQLQVLYLANTPVMDVSVLAPLTQLQELYLNNTQVSDLSALNGLTELKTLTLQNCQIKVFPLFLLNLNLPVWETQNYSKGLTIGNNPWKHPPIEILLRGQEAIRAYYKSLENQPTKPLNEVKVIFVGEGAAGKSSLIDQLLGVPFDPHKSQTHGILIKRDEIACADEPVQVHFWDFGGQEIMHATHQFFLTERSIYVLVLDSRKEDQTEYWLKHIDAFGKGSPVLVVINKTDENPGFDLNRPFLSEKYPAIKHFARLSCKRGDGIADFQSELHRVIQDMDIRKQPFSPDWLAVKQTLSTMQRDYITHGEFQQYCLNNKVADEAQQKTLLGFLNDLGIVFQHKRQSDRFGTFIMNPLWLTQAVYRIINAPEVTAKDGFLVWDDLATILHKPEDTAPDLINRRNELRASFPTDKFGFIVGMLQQFELCYEVEKNERWMIPDLLPVSRKNIPIDFSRAAHYLFVYDFLPNSVLPTLMVQLNRWIVLDLQWRTGVVLKDLTSESYAYIEADKEAKTIAIRVKSGGANFQRSFLSLIRQTLQDINKKLNISIEEKVAVPGFPNEYIPYQDLIDLREMGETQHLIPKLRRRFVINDLLEGVETINRGAKANREKMTSIFISYSHKDTKYKEELITALFPLIRQDKIQLWDDGKIVAGERWNDEIMGHLEQANIVIALMSPNFIASDFCYSIELANALKAEVRGEKTIIPIQVRPCGWHDLPIGRIQGIPQRPVSSYSKRDNAWQEVYQAVKKALESWQSRQQRQNSGDI